MHAHSRVANLRAGARTATPARSFSGAALRRSWKTGATRNRWAFRSQRVTPPGPLAAKRVRRPERAQQLAQEQGTVSEGAGQMHTCQMQYALGMLSLIPPGAPSCGAQGRQPACTQWEVVHAPAAGERAPAAPGLSHHNIQGLGVCWYLCALRHGVEGQHGVDEAREHPGDRSSEAKSGCA